MSIFDLSGKHILVTGGTRGLGRSIALQLGRAGADVHAGYFHNDAAADRFQAELIKESLQGCVIKANLMTATGIQGYYDHIHARTGKLDCLIYNAATGTHRPLSELTQRQLSIVWQVNVGAFLDLSVKLLPLMPRGGRIIAISSEGAHKAVDFYGAVGASKGALEALSRQMAAEWAQSGINVNVIAPGMLATDAISALPEAERRMQQECKASPLKRLVSLEEVAYLAHFLCSPAASGIIGQTIAVDGGKSISSLTEV
jgi:enoyl-[acyl-carrier protein] reductase III